YTPMASKDVPSLGSPWDAVLKAAKDQLPSLDSDSSLSDFEEKEPFIFQRNQPVLIPDLAAELAEDPAAGDKSGSWVPTFKSSPPEVCGHRLWGSGVCVCVCVCVLVPVGLPTEPSSGQNARMKGPAPQGGRGPGQPSKSCTEISTLLRMAEETPMWLEGDFGSLSLSTKGSHSPAWGPQGEASPSPKGEPKTEPQDEWKDSTKRRALRRERRKMIEKGMLQKVTWDVRDLGCGDQGQAAESEPKPEVPSARAREGGLVPSLQHLEEWDLDYILKSMSKREDSPGRGKPRSAWWLADSCQGQGQGLPALQHRSLAVTQATGPAAMFSLHLLSPLPS
uniref:Dynein axonemal assembly factor 8 n=1 Tax=Castor canadensis TaxID=51338 RepID=A0A8C0ZX48_CASCN